MNLPGVSVIHDDCLPAMRRLRDEGVRVDSVVTDPPYGLSFMGKGWDHGVPGNAFWAAAKGLMKPGAYLLAFGGTRTFHRLGCAIEDAGFNMIDTVLWLYGSGMPKNARTQLKPAWEPVFLAQAPSSGTIDQNLAQHGTGVLNIDECRVGTAADQDNRRVNKGGGMGFHGADGADGTGRNLEGRWPANVLHDGSAEVLAAFPTVKKSEPIGAMGGGSNRGSVYGDFAGERLSNSFGDSGSAARFFYSAKADAFDRFGTKHPTVKPVDLVQWGVRLVTPPGGLVLDPFAGSGTTGAACLREGRRAILIEKEAEYVADIHARLEAISPGGRHSGSIRTRHAKPKDPLPLFDSAG